MLLVWTGNLSVGVKEFDDDHKRLLRMINELGAAIRAAGAHGPVEEEEIEITLHRLENYTQYHCAREEELMAKTRFPDIEDHRREHQFFFATIAEMSQRFRGSTDPRHATELMQFMYDWLTNHIYVTDMKYASHLHANGIF